MQKITDKQLLEIYIEYDKILRRFVANFDLYTFEFSLKTFEICHNLFSDYEDVGKNGFISQKEYKANRFLFCKLTKLLSLENNLEVINNIFILYNYVLIFCNEFQKRCFLCTYSDVLYSKLSPEDLKEIAKENKYKFRQRSKIIANGGTFEHYFYEWHAPFLEDRTSVLKMIDSVRSNLIENGDTQESINSRDCVISLLKHYEYLSKGVTVEQSKPNK